MVSPDAPVRLGGDHQLFVPLVATSNGALGVICELCSLAMVRASDRSEPLSLSHFSWVWEKHYEQSDEEHVQHLRTKAGRLRNLFADPQEALVAFGSLQSGGTA